MSRVETQEPAVALRPMRVDWLVPARVAKVRDDGTIDVLGAGVDTLIRPKDSPTVLQLTLAMRVAGPARDWGRPQRVRVTVHNEGDVEPILVYEESHTIAEAAALEPTRDIGILLAIPCRWGQRSDGTVDLQVWLNDGDPVVVPLRVV